MCKSSMIFAHDYSYAHWLPVHHKDLAQLQVTEPEVCRENLTGNFIVYVSNHKFSFVVEDQSRNYIYEVKLIFVNCARTTAFIFDSRQKMSLPLWLKINRDIYIYI